MEVDYCDKWHRLCEALYRDARQEGLPPVDWHTFSTRYPGMNLPGVVKSAADLAPEVLNRVLEHLVREAVLARLCASDLGLLDLIDPLRLKHLPPSIYGAEPDPFEGNGVCDHPPDN